MKFLALTLLLFIIIPGAHAAQYIAPADTSMSLFTASSPESGVLNNGDDLGNSTAVFFYHDTYGIVLSFKINKSQDLDLSTLKAYVSNEKVFVNKGSSPIGFYTLYLPQSNDGKGVYLCPDAKSLDDVNNQCSRAIQISGAFPQIQGFLIAEIKNMTNNVYSISGIQSGGIGFLDQNVGGGVNGVGRDSKPIIEAISPQEGERTSNPVFKCYASDDKELKLIELYSDIRGSMQSASRKVTDKKESLLEFNPGTLPDGNYSFYCKVTDGALQESQTGVVKFEVFEQKSSVCVEKWECSPWTPLKCEEGERTRACTDKNQCGTLKNKPIETQSCKETCVEDWACSVWSEGQCGFRSCEDMNLCSSQEQKIPKPEEYIQCDTILASNQYIAGGIIFLIIIVIFVIFRHRKFVEN